MLNPQTNKQNINMQSSYLQFELNLLNCVYSIDIDTII